MLTCQHAGRWDYFRHLLQPIAIRTHTLMNGHPLLLPPISPAVMPIITILLLMLITGRFNQRGFFQQRSDRQPAARSDAWEDEDGGAGCCAAGTGRGLGWWRSILGSQIRAWRRERAQTVNPFLAEGIDTMEAARMQLRNIYSSNSEMDICNVVNAEYSFSLNRSNSGWWFWLLLSQR